MRNGKKGAPYTVSLSQRLNRDAQPSGCLPVTCIAPPDPYYSAPSAYWLLSGGMWDPSAGKEGTKDARWHHPRHSKVAPLRCPTPSPAPVTAAQRSGPFRCPTGQGGREEGAQVGAFQFSAPSFTPLSTTEQQFAGHPLTRKPKEMHKQLHRLLRLSGEGPVRLKLARITVTTGVRLFYSSEV